MRRSGTPGDWPNVWKCTFPGCAENAGAFGQDRCLAHKSKPTPPSKHAKGRKKRR